MSDLDVAIRGLAALISVVDPDQWPVGSPAADEQAHLYLVVGARDVRIADVTFQAVSVARTICRITDAERGR